MSKEEIVISTVWRGYIRFAERILSWFMLICILIPINHDGGHVLHYFLEAAILVLAGLWEDGVEGKGVTTV